MPAVSYLDRLLDERTSLTGVMQSLRDRAAEATRDLDDSERSELARLQERCAAIDDQLTEHEAQMTSARAFAELQSRIDSGREDDALERRSPGRRETTAPVSAGELVTTSEAFGRYAGRGRMDAVEVTDYLPLETRAPILTTDLSIPPFVWTNPAPAVTSPLVGVVNTVRVSSGVVEWVEVGPDPVAAVVAEGAAKPEAAIAFTPKTSTLDTIAHWVQITRQALADAAYMRSLIEGKLRRGLLRKVEADIAALLGAAVLQPAVDADLSIAIRKGIALVEVAGYVPNAVILNPLDWAALDVNAANVSNTGPIRRQTYWALTPIPVATQPAGSAIVGDFLEGVTLFDRGVSDVFVTDSHADLFIKNVLVILAEGRYKSAITDPLALAETAAAGPMAYAPGAGYPTLVEIRAWLKLPATVLPDPELDVVASAEQTVQTRLDWGDGDLPADALGAFYRRCARHAAARGVPLGILGADAEYGAVRLSRFDAEIDRLEAPYVIPVVA